MTAVDTGLASRKPSGSQKNPAFVRRDFLLSTTSIKVLNLTLTSFLLVRLFAMWAVPFTDTTEARYGEIARKMVETGNWITPQIDYGVPFWAKPPLHTWLSAGGMELFGISEFAARLPIFLTSIAVLLLMFAWVAGIAGRNTALLSVAILSSMGLFFGASAFVMTDMTMVLGTTLVMVAFWNTVCRASPSTLWGLAIFVGLAVGLMAKGPVAVVICFIPILGWLALSRRWELLIHVPWTKGIALMLVLTAPWYIVAEIATPGFLRYFLVGEHFERFVVPGWQGDLYGSGHSRPKGQIWLYWLATAFPWSFLIIPLLYRFRRVRLAFSKDKSNWLLYLLLWVVSPLVLFTPAANILPSYTLPGLPAAAILLIVLVEKSWDNCQGFTTKLSFSVSAVLVLLLFGVVSVLARFAPEVINLKTQRELVASANDLTENAPIYMVGGSTYSGDFYTSGKAKIVAMRDVPALLSSQDQIAFSVPNALAARFSTQEAERVGTFGRRVLFIKDGTGE